MFSPLRESPLTVCVTGGGFCTSNNDIEHFHDYANHRTRTSTRRPVHAVLGSPHTHQQEHLYDTYHRDKQLCHRAPMSELASLDNDFLLGQLHRKAFEHLTVCVSGGWVEWSNTSTPRILFHYDFHRRCIPTRPPARRVLQPDR